MSESESWLREHWLVIALSLVIIVIFAVTIYVAIFVFNTPPTSNGEPPIEPHMSPW